MAGIASGLGEEQVCCLTGAAADDSESSSSGLRIYRCPKAFSGSRAARATALGWTIARIMLRERPRIVQIATVGDGYVGWLLQRSLRLPYVVYAHGNEIYEALGGPSDRARISLQRANRVIAVSRFTADLVKQTGVPPARIEIVHPGCDLKRFCPREVPAEIRQQVLGKNYRHKVILSVGTVQRKGHDMTLRALPALLKRIPNLTYVIAGEGPNRSTLEKLATELGIRPHVIFPGHVKEEELPILYSLCDVFVMPSREQRHLNDVEGFGIVFLEAAACAKPVIGGRSGGIADAVLDGVTGLLVDPNSPESIAAAVERLLTDPLLAKRLGEEGRRRAVRCFSWSSTVARIQDVLERVLHERHPSSVMNPTNPSQLPAT